jgi:glycosyltransferase involved in cell wall biosynthesis
MQFFPGEGAVGSQQPIALAKRLAARGHEVTVVSADYNLDTDQLEREIEWPVPAGGQLRVIRLPAPRGGRGTNRQRLWSYVRFAISALRRSRSMPRADVVIGSIQPMFTGWAARRAAFRWRCPFVLEVRDLWPDALVVKGAVGPFAARPLHWMVNSLYRAADRIVSLTPGIKIELVKKRIAPGKIDVFPNGFDPTLFECPPDARARVRKGFEWGDDFVAIYAGSFSKVTAIDVLVKAAARLQSKPGMRFELFGRGPTRVEVEDLARGLGVTNVHFHDPVPKPQVPALLAAADVGLMSLFPTPLAHIYFENKFMDYLGAGLPIFAAMDGEQARIVRERAFGVVVPPGRGDLLADALRDAADGRYPLAQFGSVGGAFVRERLLLPEILDRYAEVVEAAAEGTLAARPAWGPLE